MNRAQEILKLFEVCPLDADHYGTIPDVGGYSSATEYEIGAQIIAEAAHCILGSLNKIKGGGDKKTEYGHIHEELKLIQGAIKEYSRSLYFNRLSQHDKYSLESIASINKISPKLIKITKNAKKNLDKSYDKKFYNVAYQCYEVIEALAKAMSDTSKGAFQDKNLIKQISLLEKTIKEFYSE